MPDLDGAVSTQRARIYLNLSNIERLMWGGDLDPDLSLDDEVRQLISWVRKLLPLTQELVALVNQVDHTSQDLLRRNRSTLEFVAELVGEDLG